MEALLEKQPVSLLKRGIGGEARLERNPSFVAQQIGKGNHGFARGKRQ